MTINLQKPDITELKPRITVFGVGGGGGNAVNNMIETGLRGVEFVCANTDSQALSMSKAERVIQLGANVTEGLGAGANPEIGAAAAEECVEEINDHLDGTHMCFVTAGMGGGTGTGAAPVVAKCARERGILTVGVVTKPFHFEGQRRMRMAGDGIDALMASVDTLIVIPNQNLFRVANDKTTFTDAFAMADQVLYSGVASITDLMVKQGLVNLDFADVRSVMRDMGKAMMGTGEASGEGRALAAAEAAIANPLLDESSMRGARGLLISITGGPDMTLFELDEAANRIREEVDEDANIIMGATYDEELNGNIRVSVVATGIENAGVEQVVPVRPTQRTSAVAQQPAPAPSASTAAPGRPAPGTSVYAARPAAYGTQPGQHPTQAAPVQQPSPQVAAPSIAAELEGAVAEAVNAPSMPTSSVPSPEEFPAQAQRTMRSAHGYPNLQADERSPMGLLKRLTTGMAKREEEGLEAANAPAPSQAHATTSRVETVEPVSIARHGGTAFGAPSVTQGQAAARQAPEDELEIPAFLRRHVG